MKTRISTHLRILAAVLALLLSAGSVWALSDAEYLALVEGSPEFKAADAKLNEVWTKAKGAIPPREYEVLYNEQRSWISYERDELTKRLVADTKISPSKAYILVTEDRTEQLQRFFTKEARKPYTYTGVISAGIGRFATYSIGAPDDTPAGSPEWFGIAPTRENLDALLSVCQDGEVCTVTGVLDINKKYFATVTGVTLVKRGIFSATATEQERKPPHTKQNLEEQRLAETLARIKQMSQDLLQ